MAEPNKLFPITSHTLIHSLQSVDQATREVSLARFCTLYYPAIYGFARMRGLDIEDAKDRTQDFFVEVVRDGLLSKFDAARSPKLSSWLMMCFKNMDLNHRAAHNTAKRGGTRDHVPYDPDFAEHAYQTARAAMLPEQSTTDLMLALGFWQEVSAAILKRFEGRKEQALVRCILPYTLEAKWPPPPAPTQTEVAEAYGTTTTRLKAFFNRTLQPKIECGFAEVAREAKPNISDEEIQDLWTLLLAHHG